jgi:hypothetical protein
MKLSRDFEERCARWGTLRRWTTNNVCPHTVHITVWGEELYESRREAPLCSNAPGAPHLTDADRPSPITDSFADDAGDKECRESGEQEKERRFGLLPIKGNVDKLKNREEQTT